MCLSATASFSVGAVLIPMGCYALFKAYRSERRYIALAGFPLLFGLQQFVEGGLWLIIGGHWAFSKDVAALGFLFFAYLLWPFLVPYAAHQLEVQALRRRSFRVFSLVGLAFGASLFIPLLLYPEWLVVTMAKGSIHYQPVLIYDGMIPRILVRVFYATIVAIPLLFSSVPMLRRFGELILASVFVSAMFFGYAFVSVWCFFAAILSAYVVSVVHRQGGPHASVRRRADCVSQPGPRRHV